MQLAAAMELLSVGSICRGSAAANPAEPGQFTYLNLLPHAGNIVINEVLGKPANETAQLAEARDWPVITGSVEWIELANKGSSEVRACLPVQPACSEYVGLQPCADPTAAYVYHQHAAHIRHHGQMAAAGHGCRAVRLALCTQCNMCAVHVASLWRM